MYDTACQLLIKSLVNYPRVLPEISVKVSLSFYDRIDKANRSFGSRDFVQETIVTNRLVRQQKLS